jgi:hypothetical protein
MRLSPDLGLSHTLHCKQDPIYVLPEMKLRGLVPNLHIHVSVSDFYTPRSVPPILQQSVYFLTEGTRLQLKLKGSILSFPNAKLRQGCSRLTLLFPVQTQSLELVYTANEDRNLIFDAKLKTPVVGTLDFSLLLLF